MNDLSQMFLEKESYAQKQRFQLPFVVHTPFIVHVMILFEILPYLANFMEHFSP